MRTFAGILALLVAGVSAGADQGDRLQALYAAIGTLDREQQALFRQFQMLQELRRGNDRSLYAARLGPAQFDGEAPSYSELMQSQRDLVRHGEELARQSDELYARYRAIEASKASLQQDVLELALPR